ncbi:MAG: hypothetical protein M1829_000257 [Trizodia sp. TS-e1964]|nr:MAG: hypothetical protein M1829_000257 [Trizodia sp. TS-e1964]
MDPNGNHIGYMAERDLGFGSTIARQWFKTHRSFTTHVFDKYQKEVLRFHRPFAWISSRIRVYDPLETAVSSIEASNSASLANIDNQSAQTSSLELSNMRVIGEAQQQWAPLRRKYNLFIFQESPKDTDLGSGPVSAQDLQLSESQNLQVANQAGGGEYGQFAYVDEPFLSWDFSLFSADSRLIGSVNRNFAGLAKELFTDMGTYALRMDAAGLAEEPKHMISQTACKSTALAPTIGMSLDQRAVMLCTAVSIDFDYFSRHSSGGGLGFMPLWFPGMGGEAAAGGAAAEAGAAEGAGAIGTVGRGVGVREGAAAGAGTMAGYEAMQRGGAPQPDESLPDPSTQEPSNYGQGEEVWGERSSPPGDSQGGVGGSQGSGDEGGGGWSDLLDDFFDE